ncbi:putative F-box protein [Hordeum vulgare]|uniref:F-box domain-containing protein n=1 Tax=Hordeum vulgare subsp. vulgare TaxID=112509 RepID=A0A8I6XIR7_HORVV|nr:putative F-box protein [Hordeum vulgare]
MKRRRQADRLSALPDEMIQHILSQLPSEEAARTSLLSRRWRHVPAGVTSVDLADPAKGDSTRNNMMEDLDLPVCFAHKVTGAILGKAPSAPIHTLRLDAFNPPDHLLDQWIGYAVSSGAEDINVKLRYWHMSRRRLCPYGSSEEASADFEKCERNSYTKAHNHLFRCRTLRRLRLTNWWLDLHGTVSMASLETLCLARIMDPKGLLQHLLSNCPRLADLTLQECPSLTKITVASAHLRSLAVICCHHARRIKLGSTCLQSLHYKGGLPRKSLFKLANHAGVAALTVEICEDLSGKEPTDFAPAIKLIRRCTKLAYLHLSLRPSMAYHSSFTDAVPCLQNLRQLGLRCTLCDDDDIRSVAVLLRDTQNLEVLSLFPLGPEITNEVLSSDSESDMEPENNNVEDGVDYSSQVTDSGFWPMQISCLDDKLTRINIAMYRGMQLEKMLAKFLLSKAAALEEFSVTLTAECSQSKRKVAKELRSWRSNHHAKVTVSGL